MIYLDFTTKKLQVVLSGAVTTNQMEISVYYYDMIPQATTTLRRGGTKVAMSNNTTDVDIMDAPTLHGTVRNVHTIMIHNKDTVTQTVTVKLDDAGTETILVKQSVAAGESLTYEDNAGWEILSPITPPFVDTTPIVHGSADVTKFLRIEVDGITTSTTRVWTVADADIKPAGHATGLTSTRVPYATGSTGGVLTDSANLTFDGTTLTLTGLSNSGNTVLGDADTDTGTFRGTTTLTKSSSAAAVNLLRLSNIFGATIGNAVVLSLDPSNNGFDIRDAQIVATATPGATQIQLEFKVANGGVPVAALTIASTRAITAATSLTVTTDLTVNGNTTLGNGGSDVTTVAGVAGGNPFRITSASGDTLFANCPSAGSGYSLSVFNSALTDYEPIVLTGEVVGLYASTGVLTSAETLRASATASQVNFWQIQGAPTANGPFLAVIGNDTNIDARWISKGTGLHYFQTGGGSYSQLIVANTTSAVNALTITGATTGVNGPIIGCSGETNVGIRMYTQGTGNLFFGSAGGTNQVSIQHTASATRYMTLTGSNGGNPTIGTSAGNLNVSTDFDVTRASVGGTVSSVSTNSDNTNAASHAALSMVAGGSSGGDPKISWIITSVVTWAAGLDNDDSDKWKLGVSASVGTSTVIACDSSLRTTMYGVTAVGGATVSDTTYLITPASTTGVSSARIPHGSAPTSPVNGDVWTTTGGVFARINSATEGPYIAAATTNTLTNKSIDGATNTITNIAQGALKTTTGDVSNSFTIASHLTLPGGTYGWYPQTWISGGNATTGQVIISNPVGNVNTSAVTLIYVDATGMSQGSLNARQRYVQASPPYNLGNGDIPLFIFALVDSLGHIKSTYIAPDPPWANNGPTDIRADYYRNGIGFKKPQLTHEQQIRLRDPKQRDAVLRELAETEDVELTYAVKNSNMLFIPHPFTNTVGMTVILLDTLTTFGDHIGDLHTAGERISDFLHEGDIVVDNVPINCITPPGVIAVAASWKLT